eukprot:7719612-Pyramimonas_sp.AAC.1
MERRGRSLNSTSLVAPPLSTAPSTSLIHSISSSGIPHACPAPSRAFPVGSVTEHCAFILARVEAGNEREGAIYWVGKAREIPPPPLG